MKLPKLGTFNGAQNLAEVVHYLKSDLTAALTLLNSLARQIRFEDNFANLFISDELSIGAGEEVRLRNQKGIALKYMIPVSISDGDAMLTKGATAWTDTWLYVKNQGSDTITTTIMFFN